MSESSLVTRRQIRTGPKARIRNQTRDKKEFLFRIKLRLGNASIKKRRGKCPALLSYHQFSFYYFYPTVRCRATVVVDCFIWCLGSNLLWTSWVPKLIENLSRFFTIWLFKNFSYMSLLRLSIQDKLVWSLSPKPKSLFKLKFKRRDFFLKTPSIRWILDAEEESFLLFDFSSERLDFVLASSARTNQELHFVFTIESLKFSIVKDFFKLLYYDSFHGVFWKKNKKL